MARFEVVSRFADKDISLPVRKTAQSAGYDFQVAEDIIIQPYLYHVDRMKDAMPYMPYELSQIAKWTKELNAKPRLVSTGIKCKLEPRTYLELSMRSSTPLKHWLILANAIGIIDADYYNNPDNEGEIFFQVINLSPFPIRLRKGDTIGQGIIKEYLVTEDDKSIGMRKGGFGSTG